MCVGKNTSQAASVEFVRRRCTNYARSRLQTLCQKSIAFLTILAPGACFLYACCASRGISPTPSSTMLGPSKNKPSYDVSGQAMGAAHGHASAAAARRALGAPARPGAVRPVSGNSGRQRCSARLRRDIAAAVWRPRCHGSAVFSPRRAALADAAGHRTVKLHKGNRQKFASAGFLPFSAQKCRAALHFTDRRGILFSLEKHMSAYRGQFSSDLK